MAGDGGRYRRYEFDGSVGEDVDIAAVVIALVVVAVFGLGILFGWLVL